MRRITALLIAILVVLLPTASPVDAASCNGKSHTTTLTNGAVSPGSATLGTPMTFRVRYADTGGCIPSVVSVTVQGVGTFTMSTGGTDLVAGVEYSWSTTLPVGSYRYSFSTTSGKGNGQVTVTLTDVAPVSAVVTNPPPPTPVPTPVPTPKPATPPPTPRPTTPAAPATTPAPAATAPPAGPTGPSPTSAPGTGGSTEPSPSPASGSVGSPSPSGSASSEPPTSTPSPSPTGEPTDDGAGVPVPPGRGSDDGNGAGTAPDGALPMPALAAALAASTIGLGLWLVAGRRRRGDETGHPPATTVELTTTAGDDPPTVSKLPPMRELVPPINVVMLEDEDAHIPRPPDEVDMPRWLRPSLRAARHAGSRDRRWDD